MRLISAIKSTSKFLLAASALMSMTDIIIIFVNLDTYEDTYENFLVYLAILLLGPLYALIIRFFVLYPTQVWAENKLQEDI
jgi:hypothetical protein